MPGTLDELVTLPGVGRKTANVVLGNAFDVPGHHRRHALRPAGPPRSGWTERDDPVKVEGEVAALIPKPGVDDAVAPADLPRPADVPRPQARLRGLPAGPAVPVVRRSGRPTRSRRAKLVKSPAQMMERGVTPRAALGSRRVSAGGRTGSSRRRRLPDVPGRASCPGSSGRADGSRSRSSAVLILFADARRPRADVLLIQRAGTLRAHAGQVAFPGGATEPEDAGAAAAALREAEEEVGLDPAGGRCAGSLPALLLPVAGSPSPRCWPGGRGRSRSRVVDPAEVAGVAGSRWRSWWSRPTGSPCGTRAASSGRASRVGGLFVWGFTAGLLDRLLQLAGWERPWDTGRMSRPAAGLNSPAGCRRHTPGRVRSAAVLSRPSLAPRLPAPSPWRCWPGRCWPRCRTQSPSQSRAAHRGHHRLGQQRRCQDVQ